MVGQTLRYRLGGYGQLARPKPFSPLCRGRVLSRRLAKCRHIGINIGNIGNIGGGCMMYRSVSGPGPL